MPKFPMDDRYLDSLDQLAKETAKENAKESKTKGRGIRRPIGEILALTREIRHLNQENQELRRLLEKKK